MPTMVHHDDGHADDRDDDHDHHGDGDGDARDDDVPLCDSWGAGGKWEDIIPIQEIVVFSPSHD
eukprot:12412794-Karenia_brevis.AAC.1